MGKGNTVPDSGWGNQRLSEMSDYIRNEGDTECVRLLALEYFV